MHEYQEEVVRVVSNLVRETKDCDWKALLRNVEALGLHTCDNPNLSALLGVLRDKSLVHRVDKVVREE